jgi:hypothetical protein
LIRILLIELGTRASAGEPKNKVDKTIKNGWLFEAFEERKNEFHTFQSYDRSFLSETGAALTFFASVFCVKTKNEVGFGRSAN